MSGERLTDARLAEIRAAAYDPAYAEGDLESWDLTIRELLAHVDAQQAEIDRLTVANKAHEDYAIAVQERIATSGRTADFERDRFEKMVEQCDRLASQVGALRELCKQLPSYCPCRAIQGLADDECIQEHNAHCATTLKERALADTEAAAREHDQRQRLEGAREFAKRVQEEAAKGPSLYATSRHAALAFAFKDVLADMEADHASR